MPVPMFLPNVTASMERRVVAGAQRLLAVTFFQAEPMSLVDQPKLPTVVRNESLRPVSHVDTSTVATFATSGVTVTSSEVSMSSSVHREGRSTSSSGETEAQKKTLEELARAAHEAQMLERKHRKRKWDAQYARDKRRSDREEREALAKQVRDLTVLSAELEEENDTLKKRVKEATDTLNYNMQKHSSQVQATSTVQQPRAPPTINPSFVPSSVVAAQVAPQGPNIGLEKLLLELFRLLSTAKPSPECHVIKPPVPAQVPATQRVRVDPAGNELLLSLALATMMGQIQTDQAPPSNQNLGQVLASAFQQQNQTSFQSTRGGMDTPASYQFHHQ